ncbi:MAG: DUF1549 and DUF1553 domain-containing protein [Akkermansiaceae bacterium]
MRVIFTIFAATLMWQTGFAESKHWAYNVPASAVPPKIDDPFISNPIDAFILKGLREAGIETAEMATDQELRRRLSYDLTGLPPEENTEDWDKLVDRYLASPRFGEKFATHWLDLVRYAETNGFERDSMKPEIWRYRDYVIKAFNENTPYDRFIIEQIAGDQLPDKTLDSCLATGFLTLMQRDDEPADRPQAHADVISDMLDVTGEAFMATTMGCAKCHDHKVDPITQADYFAMRSFFAGIKQDLLKRSNQTWIDPEVVKKRDEERREQISKIDTLWKEVDGKKLDSLLKKVDKPRLVALNPTRRIGRPADQTWSLPSFDAAAGGFAKSNQWPRDKDIVVRSEFGLQEIPQSFLVYLKGSLEKLELYLNGALVHEGLVDQVAGAYFIPLPVSELTTGKNVLGMVARGHRGPVEVKVTLDPIHNLDANQFAGMHPAVVSRVYGKDFGGRMSQLQKRKKELDRPVEGVRYLGVHENDSIPTPKIHQRGSVHAQGDEVPVAFPKVLDPTNARPERTRLELAKWIASPNHPTTARVWANRLWQYCFGKGLVESANEFGKLGTGVSNQALLDWLALELVRSGWDTKHLIRLMVTSSTYRLSSRGMNEKDPINRLHWRANSRRLSAEEIWDTYLILTGQMKFDLGGPPVRPKMPEAVLATSSRPRQVWPASPGDSGNRRAVYIHVKRSIKLPILSNFDAPEREFSCPSRFATTVPTQALTMLNSERMNEFSDRFAARLQGSVEDKTKQAFLLATSREISDGEMHEIMTLAADLKKKHKVEDKDLMSRICLLILNLNETLYLD